MTSNCSVCLAVVFELEKIVFHDVEYHKNCFRCAQCNRKLDFNNANSIMTIPYCEQHAKEARIRFFTPTMLYIEGKKLSCSHSAMDVLAPFAKDTKEEQKAEPEPEPELELQVPAAIEGLNANQFRPFELMEIEKITHDTSRFRFGLEDGQSLLLPTASCILASASVGDNDDLLVRPYTPITPNSVKGYFDLLIKVYPDGKMSNHIHSLKVGDKLELKGPFLKYQYPFEKRRIGCIAGGTGLTPVLQCIHEILENPGDKTQIDFIFASASPQDILMKEHLDHLAEKHENFNIYYIVRRTKHEDNWRGPTGYVTEEMVNEFLPPPSEDILMFVCGPPSLMRSVCGEKGPKKTQGEVGGLFKRMCYTKEMVYKF